MADFSRPATPPGSLLCDRLDKIERALGSLDMEGMTADQIAAVTFAWWESRHEVPRDDELRRIDLEANGVIA